jgi:hypothetical protein
MSGTGVNPSNEHDITVTASLDTRSWSATITPRTSTGSFDTHRWDGRLE